MQQAQDTFNAELPGGGNVLVVKGSAWPDKHPVVALDGGRGHLFRPLIEAEDQPPPAKTAKAPAAKTAAARAGAGK